MIIDMKYYITTIVAIFVSLGIGIFIGFNMDGEEIYLRQQQQLVESLENHFNDLRFERENLYQALEVLELEQERNTAFMEKAYSEFSNNRLSNFNIAIIQTTENYYYDDVMECIEAAGGFIALNLLYSNNLLSLSKEEINKINNYFNINLSKEQIIARVNNDIVDFIAHGQSSKFIDYIIDRNLIQLIDNKSNYSMDYVIIAGGHKHARKNEINKVDLDLIHKLKMKDIKTVGIERSDVEYSHIPYYKNTGISTIDNIETLMGKISLIFVLDGREGYFGIKDYAEKLVPIGIN